MKVVIAKSRFALSLKLRVPKRILSCATYSKHSRSGSLVHMLTTFRCERKGIFKVFVLIFHDIHQYNHKVAPADQSKFAFGLKKFRKIPALRADVKYNFS